MPGLKGSKVRVDSASNRRRMRAMASHAESFNKLEKQDDTRLLRPEKLDCPQRLSETSRIIKSKFGKQPR
jgi:hypothetical protein